MCHEFFKKTTFVSFKAPGDQAEPHDEFLLISFLLESVCEFHPSNKVVIWAAVPGDMVLREPADMIGSQCHEGTTKALCKIAWSSFFHSDPVQMC